MDDFMLTQDQYMLLEGHRIRLLSLDKLVIIAQSHEVMYIPCEGENNIRILRRRPMTLLYSATPIISKMGWSDSFYMRWDVGPNILTGPIKSINTGVVGWWSFRICMEEEL